MRSNGEGSAAISAGDEQEEGTRNASTPRERKTSSVSVKAGLGLVTWSCLGRGRECGYFCELLGQIPMIRDDEFRLLFEAAPNGMIVIDQAGAIVFINAQTEKLFGYSRGELVGQAVELLLPERFRATHAALRDQFGKNPQPRAMGAGRDLCGRRKDGSELPVEIGINPFHSGDRALVIASVVDISERKRNEEHVHFIMSELSHRSKNLLMVVLAIANQTVKRATSFGEFQKQFEGRIMAIARCHDLLVEQGWAGASIQALILAQLEPFADSAARVDAAGPPIMLHPEAIQQLGLALYELATNAMKYGALSSPAGRIVIRWAVDQSRTPKKFCLSWEERGGPHVDPPTYEGFGHKLLSQIAEELPNTECGLVFGPEGVSWRLECAEELVLRH